MRVGVVGCGVISRAYQQVAGELEVLEITACADLDAGRAASFAEADETGRTRALALDDLLADEAVDLVLNLTVPAVHAEVGAAALAAGKALYSEKPLATTRESAAALLAAAEGHGLAIGCAPDTFLGAGLQTCRRALDEGQIGEPVAAVALLAGHGPEEWHPNPAFFYEPGAGPLFDMGPYYLTTTVALLGPIRSVSGVARISQPRRPIRRGPLAGQALEVHTPTHVAGTLELVSGIPVTLLTSFDVWTSSLPRFEIYGTEGTLSVPDPNTFGGPVRLWRADEREWRGLDLVNDYREQSRGIGLADLASAILAGRTPRASGRLAYHVVDVLTALLEAAANRCVITVESTVEQPEPLPLGLRRGAID